MRGRPVTSRAEYERREVRHRDTLAGVVAAHSGLAAAQDRLRAATDARAAAVYEARCAGVTLRRLGALLGMAHKNVLVLERRGAELLDAPAVARAVGAATGGSPGPGVSPHGGKRAPESDPGPVCLREGCPYPAADGHRFCRAHQWS